MFELLLTETHLKKSTMNGGGLVDIIGDELGFKYEYLNNGDKIEFVATFEPDDVKTLLRFYKPKSKPERRFSIKHLGKRAKAGQWLRIWFEPELPEPIRIKIENE